jgi:predicted transcriptional regulator
MNNERTVVLENISGQPVGLKDTQNRTYRFGVGGKIRISEISLQDILDYPASKIIFNEGMMKIDNISATRLYEMGLTEAEIKKYLGDNYAAAVITETVEEEVEEEPKEEEIIKIEEPKVEEIKEEEKEEKIVEVSAVKAPARKPATRKVTTRKSTTRKKSSTKTK